MAKTIFITGASRGFGKLWANAFLERGDKVVATARNLDTLSDLVKQYGDSILALQLDVNDRAACFAAIKTAQAHFGRIDVLINNAGYGLFGSVEEVSEKEARDQMDTNFFGLLWMTQAILPVMREQGSGHIIQLSSVLGLITTPVLSVYNASKFAVEGLSESLAAEVSGFGIHITLVEPASFGTEWGGTSAVFAGGLDVYADLKAAFQARYKASPVGNPEATVPAILELVDNSQPPLRLLLGKTALPWVKQTYNDRITAWEKLEAISTAAHGN
jgi:NAD(P)-dependent dehydrogenase (short-subunit alcohol dehydrogenase family)